MNVQKNRFLVRCSHARETLKRFDPDEVALVKGVFDSMVHRFGAYEDNPDLTPDEEYLKQWNECRDRVRDCLVENKLITEGKFITIWAAVDTLSTEEASAFS